MNSLFSIPPEIYLYAAETLDQQARIQPTCSLRVCAHIDEAFRFFPKVPSAPVYPLMNEHVSETKEHWGDWFALADNEDDTYQPRILWLLLMAEAVKPSKKKRK